MLHVYVVIRNYFDEETYCTRFFGAWSTEKLAMKRLKLIEQEMGFTDLLIERVAFRVE